MGSPTYVVEVAPAKPAEMGSQLLDLNTGQNWRKMGPYDGRMYIFVRHVSAVCQKVDEKVACLGSAMASIGLGPHGRVGVMGRINAIDYIVAHSESSLLFSQSSKLACWQRLFLRDPQVTLLYIGVERMHR
eukprot:jgi/Picre1/31429/NNA_006781.t1